MRHTLYTDGSCHPPRNGVMGCAYVLELDGRVVRRHAWSESPGTAQRAELLAAAAGLAETPEGASVTLVTDSMYLAEGLRTHLDEWRKEGYRGVAHKDVWETLRTLQLKRKLVVRHVPAHSGVSGNEECDRMAGDARRSAS